MMDDRYSRMPADDAVPIGMERYRPRFHFTPRLNWMNDPNGLVHFEDEYHLFYQYNPFGKDWGHMSWGHAVSPDLLHWEELPVAIPETDQMIFSGCALIDRQNASGLGDGTTPPMLAFFTAHDDVRKIQTQHLAFSLDSGRTFRHFAGNPVIDLGLEHFRDPKIFHHAETGQWIMVVALPRKHQVTFYRSANLIDWDWISDFGPAGATGGQWECPDLFPLTLAGETFWVLKVDVDDDLIAGGSGGQYFVGHFDGIRFTVDPARAAPDGDLVDLGPDFYAAVTWADLPPDQPGPVWVGWMSNHQSGKAYPTDPWRGAQSLPRSLFLFEEKGRIKLGQRPIARITSIERSPIEAADRTISAGETASLHPPRAAFVQRMTLSSDGESRFSVRFTDGLNMLLEIEADRRTDSLSFRRHLVESDRTTVSQCPIPPRRGDDSDIAFQIYFDGYLLEIFLNGGALIYSACLFPRGGLVTEFACHRGIVNCVGRSFREIDRSVRHGSPQIQA